MAMNKEKYIWMDGEFVPWKDAKVHVLTHALHYGGSVFEGIKVYPMKKNRGSKVFPAIFRLDDHLKRFFYSMKAIGIKSPYTKEQLKKITIKLVKKNKIQQGYLRHIAFYGYGGMGLFWEGMPVSMAIAAIPWANYLPCEIKMAVSKWRRISPKSVVLGAKVSGHYVNSNYATSEVRSAYGADEAILLDEKGFVAEAASANIFFVKNGAIYTPKTHSILPGFTRDTVKVLAKDLGVKFNEVDISVKDITGFDEAFIAGTASEIVVVSHINGKKIGNGKIGSVTLALRTSFRDLVEGRNKKYKKWFTEVKS